MQLSLLVNIIHALICENSMICGRIITTSVSYWSMSRGRVETLLRFNIQLFRLNAIVNVIIEVHSCILRTSSFAVLSSGFKKLTLAILASIFVNTNGSFRNFLRTKLAWGVSLLLLVRI